MVKSVFQDLAEAEAKAADAKYGADSYGGTNTLNSISNSNNVETFKHSSSAPIADNAVGAVTSTDNKDEKESIWTKAKEALSYFQNDDKSGVYQTGVYNASKSKDGTWGGKTVAEWQKELDAETERQKNKKTLYDVTNQISYGAVDALNNSKNFIPNAMAGANATIATVQDKLGKDSSKATAKAEEYAEKAQEVGSWSPWHEQWVDESQAKDSANYTDREQFFGELAYSAGQQLPSMVAGGLASNIVGGLATATGVAKGLEAGVAAEKAIKAAQVAQSAASLGTMYTNVYNNTFNELYKSGQYDIKDIAMKANLDALTEVGTEVLVGGTPGFGRGLLDTAEEKVLSKVSAGLVKKLETKLADSAVTGLARTAAQVTKFLVGDGAKWLYDVLGEGVEEVVSEFLSPYIDRATIDPDASNATKEDLWRAFAGGAVTSAFFNTASVAFNKITENNQVLTTDESGNYVAKDASQLTPEDYVLTPDDAQYVDGPVVNAETQAQTGTDAQTRNANATINPADPAAPYKLSVRNAVILINKSITAGLSASEAQQLSEITPDSSALQKKLFEGFYPSVPLTYSTDMSMSDVTAYINDVLLPQYKTFTEAYATRRKLYDDPDDFKASWFAPAVSVTQDNGTVRSYTWKEYVNDYVNKNNIDQNNTQAYLDATVKASEEFEQLKTEQIAKAEVIIDKFKDSLSRFGIGIRVATAEELQNTKIKYDSALYNNETNVIVVNPYMVTNDFVARLSISHEFIHAVEMYARSGAFGVQNFKFSDANTKYGRGMQMLEDSLDEALEAFGIDAKAWREKYRKMYEPGIDNTLAEDKQKYNMTDEQYAEYREFVLRSEEDATILSNIMLSEDTMLTTAVNCSELTKGLFDFVSNLSKTTTQPGAKKEYTKVKDRIDSAMKEAKDIEADRAGEEYVDKALQDFIDKNGYDPTDRAQEAMRDFESRFETEPEMTIIDEVFDEAPAKKAKKSTAKKSSKTTTTEEVATKKADIENPIEEKPTVQNTAKKASETVKKNATKKTAAPKQTAEEAITQAKAAEKQAIKDYNPTRKIKSMELNALVEYPVGAGKTKVTKVFSNLGRDANGMRVDEIWIRPNGRTTDSQRDWLKKQGFTPRHYGAYTVWVHAFDQTLWDSLSTGSEKGMNPQQLADANDANDKTTSRRTTKGGRETTDSAAYTRTSDAGAELVKKPSTANTDGFVDRTVRTYQLSEEDRARLFGETTKKATDYKPAKKVSKTETVETTDTVEETPKTVKPIKKPTKTTEKPVTVTITDTVSETPTETKKTKSTKKRSKAFLNEFSDTAQAQLELLMQYPELNDILIDDDKLDAIFAELEGVNFERKMSVPSYDFTDEDSAQWKDLVEQYGTIKKTYYNTDANGNTKKTTVDTGIPKYSSTGHKVSQSAATLRQGLNQQLDDATRKNILNDGMSYIPVKMGKLEGQARSWLNSKNYKTESGEVDILKALGKWNNMVDANNGAMTAEDAAKGMVIWAELKAMGNAGYNFTDGELRSWDELMTRLAVVGHNYGLGLALFRQLSKLDGTGREYYMNANLDSLRSEMQKTLNAFNMKAKNVLDDYEYPDVLKKLLVSNLSDDFINNAEFNDTTTGKDFSDLKQRLLDAKTTEERVDIVTDAMKDDLAEQIPPTIASRVRAWRYLSMLGNARTHVRNIVSNAAMYLARNLRDVQSSAIQDAYFARKGEAVQTSSAKNKGTPEIRKIAHQQWLNNKNNIMAGGKLGFNADVMQRTKSFGDSVIGKALEKVSRWNSDLLESEDSWFLKATFKQAFTSYVAANEKTWLKNDANSRSIEEYFNSGNAQALENLNKAIAYATKEAQRATYREADELASWLNGQEKKGTVRAIVIEGIQPFKRTPINILKQGLRYSPAGIVNAIKKLTWDVHTGKITANGVDANGMQTETVANAIDDLCAGLTGTEIMALGIFLGGAGIMKAAGADNDKEEYYDEMTGNQKYSITIGDMNFTLDWLTPISMPLFAGVTLANALGGDDDGEDDDTDVLIAFNEILHALGTMADPFTNLSLLSGINDALNSYSDDKLGEALSSAVGNYASQFVPTMAGQIARTIDPTRRTTYAEKDVNFVGGQAGAKFWNKIKAKIPGLSMTNQPYVDQWGRTEENAGDNIVERAFNQMVSPWYAKEVNKTEVDDLIAEVFAESKDNKVIPATPQSYYTINEKNHYLKPEEYTTVKKTVGQLSYAGIQDLSNSRIFDNLTADQKADVISNIYSYARAVAKEDYADLNNIKLTSSNSDIEKVQKAEELGISLGDYYVIKMLISDKVAGTKKAEKKAVARTLGLDIEQMAVFGL